jgi:hypothetical protein
LFILLLQNNCNELKVGDEFVLPSYAYAFVAAPLELYPSYTKNPKSPYDKLGDAADGCSVSTVVGVISSIL